MATVIPDKERIRIECRRKNWSLTTLAGKSGCSIRTINRWLAGEPANVETIVDVASALGLPPEELILSASVRRLIVWFLGSHPGDPDLDKFNSKLMENLAPKLVRLGVRIVMGDSRLLQLLGASHRAALPNNVPTPPAVLLFGKLRDLDLRDLFTSTVGAVPDVAVLCGGNTEKGRVEKEYKAAKAAGIPLVPLVATGGMAAQLGCTSTDIPEALLSDCERSVIDTGDLSSTVENILRHLQYRLAVKQ